MNAKIVVALLIALQVSTSLCEVPAPSPELVATYNDLRNTFIQRLRNLYGKVSAKVVAAGTQTEEGKQVATMANKAIEDPGFVAAGRLAGALAAEMEPVVDTARIGLLGLYQEYVRPVAKDHVLNFIKNMKKLLDLHMPAN